jgi:hypothetical protein
MKQQKVSNRGEIPEWVRVVRKLLATGSGTSGGSAKKPIKSR